MGHPTLSALALDNSETWRKRDASTQVGTWSFVHFVQVIELVGLNMEAQDNLARRYPEKRRWWSLSKSPFAGALVLWDISIFIPGRRELLDGSLGNL